MSDCPDAASPPAPCNLSTDACAPGEPPQRGAAGGLQRYGGMNLNAVDRVVRIVRELDCYHGLFAAERGLPEAAFGAALTCRAKVSLQVYENI